MSCCGGKCEKNPSSEAENATANVVADGGAAFLSWMNPARGMLSPTGVSNLHTMSAVGKVKPEMALPDEPTIPSEAVRRLRARLILEEAIETVHGLGFSIELNMTSPDDDEVDGIDSLNLVANRRADLEEIIDGCCDVSYVAIGTMLACGVPDAPHMELVNKANNAKFPGGVATINEHGKFQKPEGWKQPDHGPLLISWRGKFNLNKVVSAAQELSDAMRAVGDAFSSIAKKAAEAFGDLNRKASEAAASLQAKGDTQAIHANSVSDRPDIQGPTA